MGRGFPKILSPLDSREVAILRLTPLSSASTVSLLRLQVRMSCVVQSSNSLIPIPDPTEHRSSRAQSSLRPRQNHMNGIDVLRLGFRDSDPSAAYITYGYLLGVEDRSNDYARFVDETLAYIQDVVAENVADSDKVSGMVLGYNIIYGRISDYGNVIEMAGGINAVDWYEHRYVRDGMDWLYNYDFDYIVGRVTAGGYDYSTDSGGYADVETAWNNHVNTYRLTDAVHNGNLVLLNTSVPTVINAAYLAAEFYPELFGEDYGDRIHQEYVDRFIDNLAAEDYDVSEDGLFFITSDDIES